MRSILIFTFLISQWTQAELPQLPPFPAAPINKIVPEALPEPICSEVVGRLERHKKLAYEHGQSIVSFTFQVGETATQWQDKLLTLENTQILVPTGYFDDLSKLGISISDTSNLALENAAYLAGDLDQVVEALKKCGL